MSSIHPGYGEDQEIATAEEEMVRCGDDPAGLIACEDCPAGRAGSYYCLQYEECPSEDMVFPCETCPAVEEPGCQAHWSYCPYKLGGDVL